MDPAHTVPILGRPRGSAARTRPALALPALAAFLILLLLPPPAHAATLFQNPPELGSGQDGSCFYNTTCGPNLLGVTYFAAQSFTLAAPATVNGAGFNAIVRDIFFLFGTPPNAIFGTQANWKILAATLGNAPGDVLASGTAPLTNSPGPIGASFPTTDYAFPIPALLLAAGSYFLAIQNVTANELDSLSVGTAASGAFTSEDNGLTWQAGYSIFPSVAMTVFGEPLVAAVPAPGALGLLATGLLGLGLARRRATS